LEAAQYDSAAFYLHSFIGVRADVELDYSDQRFVAIMDSMSMVGAVISDGLIAHEPSSENYHLKGTFLHLANAFDAAIPAFEQSIALQPDNVMLRFNLAGLYIRIERYQDAADETAAILQVDSTYSPAYVNRGYCNLQLEKFEDALSDFKGALRYAETTIDESYALNNIGFAYLNLGNLELARASVESSIRINSLNSYAYRNLAFVEKAEGNMDKACENLDIALEKGFTYLWGDEVEQLKAEWCK